MHLLSRPAIACLGIAIATSCGLFGQTAAGRPRFEVASIKPSDPTKGIVGPYTYPGGRVFLGHMTLQWLIEDALDVQPFQISGGLGWTRQERYDIDARVLATSQSSKARPSSINAPMNDEQREMLQELLADRFQLIFHREASEGPVYLLEKGGKPLRLDNPEGKDIVPWVGSATDAGGMSGTGIRGTNASMPFLAARLSYYLGRPVLDETGIRGSFDFKYVYASGDSHPDLISSIITSVEEIGLKLKTGKAPVETIVIDHAEKPSDN